MYKFFERLKKLCSLAVWPLAVFVLLLVICTLLNFETAEVTLRYLEVLVWPIVALIIVLLFQEELKGLVRNVVALRVPGGFEAKISQQKPPEETPEISNELKKGGVAELRKTGVDESELMNRVASLQVALHFERTYNLIFGSQIRLLESLERAGPSGRTYEDVVSGYQSEGVTSIFLSSYPLKDYLGFLEVSGLVRTVDEAGRRSVEITPMGMGFLGYTRALRYPVKPWL